MEEINEIPTSEQILKIKRKELKEIRDKAKTDRAFRLLNGAENRSLRDEKINVINSKLRIIKKKISVYNRYGKRKKDKIDILADIRSITYDDVGCVEYEREEPSTIEEIKSESLQN